ncbi:hypothetical protein ACWKSP_30055, partial [Micromonosporaceae bacterium Da 78-11]
MRKPLVVAIAASAVLLAGGIAATTADAEQAPDVPAVALPDLSGPPQLPIEDAAPTKGPGRGHSGYGNAADAGYGNGPADDQADRRNRPDPQYQKDPATVDQRPAPAQAGAV